jgi:glycosyltransferase involved in cell wall biosynthesis
MTKLLSVIIPAYNEEKTIAEIIERVLAVRQALLEKLDIDMEVIVVNDGSKDRTAERVQEYKKKHSKSPICLLNKPNGGKGSAMKAGFEAANGDFVICQDADLEYDPWDYLKVIAPLAQGKALVVYGSRELEKKNKWSQLSFYVGGKAITLSANILFNARLTDEPTCYKAFDAELIKAVPLEGNRFDWEPEVTAKVLRMKIKIIEVPISYHPRSATEGKKIKWRDGPEAIMTLFKWRFRRFALKNPSKGLLAKIARFRKR